MEDITLEDRISMEINEDEDFWLNKVNYHLEKLLEKSNRDNIWQNKMAIHYYTSNQVTKVKIKQLKENLKETLINQEENDKLYFLVDASMIA